MLCCSSNVFLFYVSLFYAGLFYVVLFYIIYFHVCPNIGNYPILYTRATKTNALFSLQFDKKAMIVKFEELDDERQKEAKLVR